MAKFLKKVSVTDINFKHFVAGFQPNRPHPFSAQSELFIILIFAFAIAQLGPFISTAKASSATIISIENSQGLAIKRKQLKATEQELSLNRKTQNSNSLSNEQRSALKKREIELIEQIEQLKIDISNPHIHNRAS